jgi:hypothetical protein
LHPVIPTSFTVPATTFELNPQISTIHIPNMSVFKSCFGAEPNRKPDPAPTTAGTKDAELEFAPKPLERRETAYDKKMRQADERKAKEDEARKARLGKSKAYTSSEPLPYSKSTTISSTSAQPVVAPTSGSRVEDTTNYTSPDSNMMMSMQGGLLGEMTQPNHAHGSGGHAGMRADAGGFGGSGGDSGADAVGS